MLGTASWLSFNVRAGLGRLQRSSLWASGKGETGGRGRGIVGFVGMEEEVVEEEEEKGSWRVGGDQR